MFKYPFITWTKNLFNKPKHDWDYNLFRCKKCSLFRGNVFRSYERIKGKNGDFLKVSIKLWDKHANKYFPCLTDAEAAIKDIIDINMLHHWVPYSYLR